MINGLKGARNERDKQIVAAILKEAEFIRNEILQSSAASRDVLMKTIVFVGVILTIVSGLLAFKVQEKGLPLKQVISANRWLLWVISQIVVLTCVAFLRIYVASAAGIAAAAAYYRDALQPRLNKVLDTQGGPVLNWENWLRERNSNRKDMLRRLPSEDLFMVPFFIWLLGVGFAAGALRLTSAGENAFVLSWFVAAIIVIYGIWAIFSLLRVSERIPQWLKWLTG
jgi:hypothetical protein